MFLNFLGKLLFPRLAAWQRKKQIKSMLLVILAILGLTALLVGLMLFENSLK